MSFIATAAIVGGAVTAAGGIAKMGMSLSGRGKRIAEQKQAKAEMEAMKSEYRNLDTSNLNAGVRNEFTNMENAYEDVTVNQQQAQFQAKQGDQQRANIMSSLRGAAGGSGIAGLAQSLAGQGTLQARQVSADISRQEAANQQLIGRGAYQVQQGAAQVQQFQLQGQAAVQAAEAGRTSTLLGMEMGEMAGARAGVQSAYANQMSGLGAISGMQNARMGMWGDIVGGIGGAAGSFASGGLTEILN